MPDFNTVPETCSCVPEMNNFLIVRVLSFWMHYVYFLKFKKIPSLSSFI